MYQETRKELKTTDISVYKPVITRFEDRLKLRNLAKGTFANYLLCLKIFPPVRLSLHPRLRSAEHAGHFTFC